MRYLLDELPDADREAFEDDYFGDEGVYGGLLAAEDDLIDRYCDGSLPPEQRRRFEQRYLATAEGRARVDFAHALNRLAAARRKRSAPAAHAALRWLPWAAVLVAAVVFLTLRHADARRARDERATLQAELSHQQQRAREQDRRASDLARELERVQEQARALGELLGIDPARAARAVSITLAGGLRRDAAALPRVSLAPETAVVRLQLQIDQPPRAVYRASLQAPEGRELWARDGLAPVRANGKSAVTFTVPAAVLAPGQYVVTLGPPGGGGESDAEFVFEVRRAARATAPSPPAGSPSPPAR